MYNSLHYRMILLHSICQVLHLYSLGEEYDKSGNFILSLYRGMNEVSRIIYMVAEMRND